MSKQQAARTAKKPALVRVKGLSKTYRQRESLWRMKTTAALESLELEILPDSLTALVGESGCGKSTLARCLAWLEKADCGEIWFEGNEITALSAREREFLRPKIQLVFQDSAGALNPRMTAAEIVAEPMEVQRLAKGRALRERACSALEEVGLGAGLVDRRPLALSGGQRQRVAIARALVLQPRFLILDESLSGLDLITQSEILGLLVQLQRKRGLTYLLISHDLSLVGQAADFVLVMDKGQIVEQGMAREILSRPAHARTQELVASAEALEAAFCEMKPAERA